MVENLWNADPDKKIMVLTTVREMQEYFGNVVRVGDGSKPEPVRPASELNTHQVRAYLLSKGYKVKSHQGLNDVLGEHGVAGKKRGKVNWYKFEDIDRIPSMK